MLNKWFGMGRLTKDPELRKTQNGKSVATFTLAVDRDYDREKTDFVSCVSWNATAEFIDRNFRKGQLAVVEGAWESRKWKDRAGNNQLTWEVNVKNIEFCGDKKQPTADVFADETDDKEKLPF